MRRLKSLTGVVHMPEIKVNFYVSFEEQEPEGKGAKDTGEEAPKGNGAKDTGEEVHRMGRILDQFSNFSPAMKEIMAEFAEYLEKREEKPGGQGPTA